MPIVIPDCETEIPYHECAPCDPGEYGRIRQAAFVKKSYVFTDITDASEWQTAVQNKDVFLIPATHGELAEASPKVGTGYGDIPESLNGYDFQVTFFDPDYIQNCDFYNALVGSRDFKLMYKTSSKGHLTNVAVTIIPVAPIADDLNARIEWKVIVKWSDLTHPCPVEVADLSCFNVTA